MLPLLHHGYQLSFKWYDRKGFCSVALYPFSITGIKPYIEGSHDYIPMAKLPVPQASIISEDHPRDKENIVRMVSVPIWQNFAIPTVRNFGWFHSGIIFVQNIQKGKKTPSWVPHLFLVQMFQVHFFLFVRGLCFLLKPQKNNHHWQHHPQNQETKNRPHSE